MKELKNKILKEDKSNLPKIQRKSSSTESQDFGKSSQLDSLYDSETSSKPKKNIIILQSRVYYNPYMQEKREEAEKNVIIIRISNLGAN